MVFIPSYNNFDYRPVFLGTEYVIAPQLTCKSGFCSIQAIAMRLDKDVEECDQAIQDINSDLD